MRIFFSWPLVPVTGKCSLQIDAQVERNDANLKAAFLNRRGQHPATGPTAGYSTNDIRFEGASDPVAAFATSLALNKVCVPGLGSSCTCTLTFKAEPSARLALL